GEHHLFDGYALVVHHDYAEVEALEEFDDKREPELGRSPAPGTRKDHNGLLLVSVRFHFLLPVHAEWDIGLRLCTFFEPRFIL
ncbi:MAG: hypothetical protein ACD_66C00160G0001, partial [uncultured bacterium]